ncbi:hypothetical protein R1sor_012469 [Riccia sorocarpa]|uniref:Elongation factor Ts, mitochondrial n=1 Tax=Riccia sorocarpa TaxID=122646 RepID=A0ABD3I479_9MARC
MEDNGISERWMSRIGGCECHERQQDTRVAKLELEVTFIPRGESIQKRGRGAISSVHEHARWSLSAASSVPRPIPRSWEQLNLAHELILFSEHKTLCQSTPSASGNAWQSKRSVPSGSALNRPSAEASVKTSFPASIYDNNRRRVGVRHSVRGGPLRHVFTAAVEGNVAIEEPSTESEVAVDAPEEQTPDAVPESSSPSESATTQRRGGKNRRPNLRSKREEPTVPLEALVPGAVFTGKVTTIQPFGAFVNFGAFTDGLVHISKLSTSYVSNVSDVVSVGQEVQVTVIDVDSSSSRIALSMVGKEEEGKRAAGGGRAGAGGRSQEENDGRPVNRGKTAGRGNQNKREDQEKKPPTKLKKGQAVEGTVKNASRGGVYVLLPEEEEGFLRYTEIPGGENMAPEAGLQVGQKVNATVLRIDRGRIFLSMKPVVDLKNVNLAINQDSKTGATNPFEIAFRAMDLIPPKQEAVEEEPVVEETPVAEASSEEEKAEAVSVEAAAEQIPAVEEETIPESPAAETVEETKSDEAPDAVSAEAPAAAAAPVAAEEKVEDSEAPVVEAAAPAPVEEKIEEVVESPAPAEEKSVEAAEPPAVSSVVEESVEEAPAPAAEEKKGGVSAAIVKKLRDETGAGMMDCKKALAESNGDVDKAREFLRKRGLASADKKASRVAAEGLIGSYIHDSRIGVLLEINCETDFVARGQAFKDLVADIGMQVVASPQVKYVSVEDIPAEIVQKETELEMQREDLASKPEAVRAKIVEGRVSKRLNESVLLEQPYIRDDSILVKDLVKQTIATLGENIKVRRFERYNLGEGLQKKNEDFAAEVAAQTAKKPEAAPTETVEAPAPAEAETAPVEAVPVSAAVVKELREATGAGMMDCKKALAASGNDVQKATEYLRKKGLASADKKASRIASEGLVGSYIHNGVIGVLLEVNCETDFVARSEKFKDLVRDIAMQVAACPSVTAVSVEDIPSSFVEAERAIELGKEDLASKPEAVRAKIVEGRLNKRFAELALLEQPFIKDDTKLVKDFVKETVAALGENIQVRRFARFNLGEGIEKKVVDFAAEVAAQTGKTL